MEIKIDIMKDLLVSNFEKGYYLDGKTTREDRAKRGVSINHLSISAKNKSGSLMVVVNARTSLGAIRATETIEDPMELLRKVRKMGRNTRDAVEETLQGLTKKGCDCE